MCRRLGEPPATSLPGLDVMDFASDAWQPDGDDVARISWHFHDLIRRYQEAFNVIEKVTMGMGVAVPPASLPPALTPLPPPVMTPISSSHSFPVPQTCHCRHPWGLHWWR